MAAKKKHPASEFTFEPLTPDRWMDLETLFGDRGAPPAPPPALLPFHVRSVVVTSGARA